jgi:5-oxopent-3-ene-1,2,5-tricarboxylate decarboxylase/2-hydroxyhepta-2,4-diene-1,7-dioate isomerase
VAVLFNASELWPLHRLGTVYGTLLNHRAALAALGDAVHQPPYKAAPKAPVLYIKPRNCHIGPGDAIVVPAGAGEVEIGANLGIVIGRETCRVAEADALACVAGYTVCNDVSLPHASFYRPSLRFKCRDTFLPIAPGIAAARDLIAPDEAGFAVEVDGRTLQQGRMDGMQRPVARLIAEVSAFMTLNPGDVLMLGTPHGAPRARAGQRVAITIDGVGTLANPLVAEA